MSGKKRCPFFPPWYLSSFPNCNLTLSLPCLPHHHLKNDQWKCQFESHYILLFSPALHKHVKGFLPKFLHKHVKGFLPKCTVLTVDLFYDHQIYCLQACMCAIFSLEILQAGAVKGLFGPPARWNKTWKDVLSHCNSYFSYFYLTDFSARSICMLTWC